MAIYLPERQHPNYGVVRVMVRDANDVRTNGSTPFYLDSDGCVSANAACTANASASPSRVSDWIWQAGWEAGWKAGWEAGAAELCR